MQVSAYHVLFVFNAVLSCASLCFYDVLFSLLTLPAIVLLY